MLRWPPYFLPPRILIGPERITDEETELYQKNARLRLSRNSGCHSRRPQYCISSPDPEEEDRLCASKVGLATLELQAKAIKSPDTLTELGCKIIMGGAD